MASKKYFTGRSLTLQEQRLGILGSFPGFGVKIHKNELTWESLLRPSYISSQYKVRIKYELGKNPQCFVVNPKLRVVKNKKRLPHVYNNEQQRLCLFMPQGNQDWNPMMSIARTIIPWASEWLFYYELWLATGGIWLGKGVHPPKQ